jgi:ABC-type amino acid transport substrate-binding protein
MEKTLFARHAVFALLLALVPASALAQPLEGHLKKIKDSKSISIAYRSDAPPFSFVDAGQPIGYSIDLCKRIVSALDQQLAAGGIQVKWVPVTVQNRFETIAKGGADMECGSSTVTLSRMKQVDFSNFIFIDSTAVLARADLKAGSLSDLAGKKIAVVAGTTNETALRQALKDRLVTANVVASKSREEAFAALEAGQVDAMASDGLLLLTLAPKMKDRKAYTPVEDGLSFEPYAIALPRNDAAFRIEVNSALARIYRSEAIGEIYGRWFGSLGKPGPALRAVYGMGAIPE